MPTIANAPSKKMPSERIFFTTMSLTMLAFIFIGFAPSFYLRGVIHPYHPMAPLNLVVFLHGLAFSAWVILFAVQTGLVASGNVHIHRRLGPVGVVLVALMLPLALLVAIGGIHRPHSGPAGIPPLSWLAVPLINIPLFAGLVIAALLKRRMPVAHKRLMLIAMVSIMGPAFGRIPVPPPIGGLFALVALLTLLIPLIVWDWRTRGRVHPATAWGSATVLLGAVLPAIVWKSG